MKTVYFTITGVHHYFGTDFMKAGMKVNLVKEPDNKADKEAIKVEMPGLGLVGYVANSPHSVRGESMSAGRMYDKIGETAIGIIKYVLPNFVICELVEENEYADEYKS